jgi:hypothetical protein
MAGTGRGPDAADPGVLFEFTRIGGQMRVAAIDVATLVEVVAIAPIAASQSDMRSLALAKLKRRLAGNPK